jgi:hypothetical protein
MSDSTTPIRAPFPETGEAVLRLRLGACRLVVRAGDREPWVEGTYRDPSGDEPIRSHLDGPELTLRQQHSVAGTIGLVHGTPSCELSLGTAQPYRLVLDTGASDVALELGGLPLLGLDISAGAGRIEMRVEQPNPVELRELNLRIGAGSLTASGLGNLAADRLRVEGGAATLDLDLTGELRRPLDGEVSTGMAGVRVTLPADRPVRVTSDARLGGTDIGDGFLTRDGAITTPVDGDPIVSLHTVVALGQLRLRTKASA